jgi:homoprotocatechuate degradation regulator HpaR
MTAAKQRAAAGSQPEHKIHRNLPLLFLQGREAVMSHFRPILNYGGVTEQQWRIIRAIYEADVLEPNQICDICQILSPSLAGMLGRMEEMGLVRKERADNDQRRILVHLTAKSRALVAKLAPLITEQYRLLEQAMGPRLVADMYSVLDRLIATDGDAVPKVSLPQPGGASVGAVFGVR